MRVYYELVVIWSCHLCTSVIPQLLITPAEYAQGRNGMIAPVCLNHQNTTMGIQSVTVFRREYDKPVD